MVASPQTSFGVRLSRIQARNRAPSSFLSLSLSLPFCYYSFSLFLFSSAPHFNSANNATIKNTHIKMKDRLDVSLISGAQQRCLNRHSLRRKRFRANFRAKTRLETHATLARTGKPFGLHFAFSSIAK